MKDNLTYFSFSTICKIRVEHWQQGDSPFCTGVVPEQASEVPAERAKLGNESGGVREQGDGSCITITSHQVVASAAARRGKQRGITTERDHEHSDDGAVSL